MERIPDSRVRVSCLRFQIKFFICGIFAGGEHDDYAAQYVGHTRDGRQFFLTTPFVPAEKVGTATGREFLALYLFDKNGALLLATIDDFGPQAGMHEKARVARGTWIA